MKRAALFAAWCLVFWLYGCATIQPVLDQFQPKPGQDEAVRIVWVDVMGRPDKPPAVRWIEGDALNCTTSSGGPGFLTPLQACVQGFTVSLWHVDVAAWPGMLFSESALPHEFLHVAKLRDNMNHAGPDWQEGGTVHRALYELGKAGR